MLHQIHQLQMNRVGFNGFITLVTQPFAALDPVTGFQIQILALAGHAFPGLFRVSPGKGRFQQAELLADVFMINQQFFLALGGKVRTLRLLLMNHRIHVPVNQVTQTLHVFYDRYHSADFV